MTPSLMLAVMARGDNGPTPGGNGTSLAATTQGGRTQYSGLPSLCPAPAHSVYTAKFFHTRQSHITGPPGFGRDGLGGVFQDRPVMLKGDTCMCICIAVSCHTMSLTLKTIMTDTVREFLGVKQSSRTSW